MPAQSVHQTRTLAHQPLPATVQQHSSLLVSRLDRHKAHRRALNRLADRFRIGGIVLVALDVRLHVLRRHQSHLVAKRAQLPPPVVRRRARLQANRQSGSRLKNARTCTRRSCLRRTVAPAASTPCTWKTCFAKSNPIVVISFMDGSLFAGGGFCPTGILAPRCRKGPSTPSLDDLVGAGEQR